MESDFENNASEPTNDINCNDNEIDDEVVDEVDSGDYISDNGTFAEAKKKFSFSISSDEWENNITIKEDKRGDRYLGGKWVQIFISKLKEQNETCALVVKSNKVKRGKVIKTKAPFFRGKVVCMFQGCVKYTLIIKKPPVAGKNVRVKVRTIPPHTAIRHEAKLTKSRPISGQERKESSTELKNEKPSQVYYRRLGEVSDRQYEAGNLTGIGSKSVLQKISSETTLAQRLHKDVITELSLQKEIYDSIDDDLPDNHIKGCIQYLSVYPFSVHIYTSKQLQILSDVIKDGNCVLYFDATGKVVSKIPHQNKRVFYYPLLLKGREKGDPPVPVAEMISNSHNTTDICNLFIKLFRDLTIFKPKCGIPKRIEIDFTWAFLHGIVLAVNRESINKYLQRAWSVLQNDEEWGPNIVIHICSAHLQNSISHHVADQMKDKQGRKYVKHVFGLMIDARNLHDLEIIYRNLAILLLYPTDNSHAEYTEAKNALDSSIRNREFDDETEEPRESDETGAESSLPGKTAFFEHLEDIRRTVECGIIETTTGTINFLHCPKLLQYINKTYMSITPLWTGTLLDDMSHDTNSPAENWMKIVKKDILNDKHRLRPGLFIRKLRTSTNGRLKEYDRKLDTCKRKRKKGKTRSKRQKSPGVVKREKRAFISNPQKRHMDRNKRKQ